VYEQIAANKRKSVLLVLGSVLVLGLLGFAVGYLWIDPVVGLVVAVAVALVQAAIAFGAGDRMVLAAARARLVSPDEEPRLHNIVEGLSIAAGIPKPRVWVIPERAPNAFATGRSPDRAHVAVTRGLLGAMNRVELEGVMAHELSHIVDRDILVGTIVATIVGAAVLVSEFFLRAFWWGGFRGRRGDDRGGSAEGILAIVGIALLLLSPIVAQVIRFTVSREREYLADAQGALLTRYPPGLAAALRKIAGDATPMRSANNATAHLWLSQPSRFEGERTGWLERLFSTHPPIEDRIRRLEEM
jgi:heat shock protein HtpX